MERTIKKIVFPVQEAPKLTRVAAYARVSSGKDAMLHSLSAQVSYYNDLIQRHPGWVFCGVYADEALTGTKADRENFTRLLQDCKAGKVDMVITKSISRFARNTVTLLETVRELKLIGVDVYFEEQNIHSISADGELMLSILASYAQEESLSASENQKWRIKRNFENGMPWNGNLLLQQTYRENHLTKRTLQNNGELPKYHIADSHEPIIPLRQFNAVQEEIKRRADKHTHSCVKQNTYPFTGMVVCGGCGKHYRRKITKTGPVWICSTFNTMGKAYCPSKQIPENSLISITEEVLGSTDTLYDKITAIRAEKDNTLVFCFKDGSETVKRWQDRSRAESWTEEMKEAARQKALERSKHNG